MATTGSASIHIEAPPERVYALVSDVTRMGEWSPETQRAEWRDGATGPAVGAQFKGSNKNGLMRWSTKVVVEVADAGREFTFATEFLGRKVTRWRYRLTPADGGTHLEESWESVERFPLIGGLFRSDRWTARLQPGMEETLRRIKTAAEASVG